jgi:hypothetical protein
VLAGGCLIAFKVRGGEPLCTRKQRYPLYGAYVSIPRTPAPPIPVSVIRAWNARAV